MTDHIHPDSLTLAGSRLSEIWADQLHFNRTIRTTPAPSFEQRTADTKELVLHLMSECDELLRASGAWKSHRRQSVLENKRAVGLELADIFKYLMTIAQTQGFTAEDLIHYYWEKTGVVRQRYSQEFVQQLDRPSVVIDIDNVLADYIAEFVQFLSDNGFIPLTVAQSFWDIPRYCDHLSLGMLPQHYEEAKHLFRVSGLHASMPVLPGAQYLLDALAAAGTSIILLTSRPIDRYPNLYSETLLWLNKNSLPYQIVWWAGQKGDAIRDAGVLPHVLFAVDDEWQYVEQFARAGVQTMWLNPSGMRDAIHVMRMERYTNIRMIRSLSELVGTEGK